MAHSERASVPRILRHSVRRTPVVARAIIVGLVGFLGTQRESLVAQNHPLALAYERVIDGNFGGLGSVAVDRQGVIYATDFMAQHIRVFSSAGVPIDTIGREGRGPGEYSGIGSIVVGRGDTLFTLDLALRKITAYAPGKRSVPSYTLSMPRMPGESPANLLQAPSAGGFVVGYEEAFQVGRGTNPSVSVRYLLANGTLARDTLFTTPAAEALVIRSGKSIGVGPLPYGREPFYGLSADDRVLWSWNDALRVASVRLDGASTRILDGQSAEHPVSRRDLDRLIASYEDSVAQRQLREAVREGKLPKTKPAFRAMVIDDLSRIWLGRITASDWVVMRGGRLSYASPTGKTIWEVLDGDRRSTVSLPEEVDLRVVRNGKAYGVHRDDDGIETIVVYTVQGGGPSRTP